MLNLLIKSVLNLLIKIVSVFLLTASQVNAQQAALVSVDEVIEQPFTQTSPILGRLVAIRSGTVAAQTSGSVSEILVRLGDSVTQGQVLATIDASTLLLQKQLTDSRLLEAKSRLKTARAELALAVQETRRLEGLKSTASISRAVYDDAKQQQNIAYSRVDEAEAAINSSKASSRLAELELSYTSITAPFDGTVIGKMTETGNYLQKGQAVLQLISDRSLELEADIPSSQLEGLNTGSALSFSLDNGTMHSATFRAIIPEENLRTRTRKVRFTPDFSPDAGILVNDQSVTLFVPVGKKEPVISVHKDGIVRQGNREIVYVVVEEKANATEIQTGRSIGNRLEIQQGLSVGDLVVVRGNERLRPNQSVKVKP